tara:strand:+ start:3847 stop:5481 length:1635 start_codon:yes stop_codon:yes gene_type:complete
MVEKRRFSIRNFLRRRTPTPGDRKVFQMGIQEKESGMYMTTPLLYNIATQSVITRTCTTQLKNEVFRRGYDWKKSFSMKCNKCGKEHENDVERCATCGTDSLRKPDEKQLFYAKNFLDGYVNESNQMLVDVLKELEDDLNIIDDAYIILVKEYYLDGNGEIKLHRIKEVYRGDPCTMAIYADEDGTRGTTGFTSLNDRSFLSDDPFECHPETHEKLHPVHYVNRVNGEEQYFVKGEVLHFSKYAPSRLYGQSPVLTLFNHITTLIAMENYVNTSYTKSRMPKGLLAVQTRNMESMKTFWRAVKEKMEEDKHFIPVMGIEADNGKGSIEWIKFMDSLKEMDYVAVKEDLRDRIAAFYGVSKIFMADNSASGGLNNEGMQILVTNRAVEMAQNVYNKYVFPWLINEFGITDWKLILPPSEEEDEIAIMRKREIEVNVAASIKNLGFDIDMNEEGEFTFKKIVEEKAEKPKEDEKIENDPYAGTNVDASQLGQLQEQSLMGDKPSPEGGGAKRNKPSMSVGPDKRNTGLPQEAGNQNIDRRTESRVG